MTSRLGVGLVLSLVLAVGPMAWTKSQDSPRAVTAEERAHARLHDRGFEGKPILTDGVFITVQVDSPRLANRPSISNFLKEQVCGADLVVSGVVLNSRSMLNSTETFIFSDYKVQVEHVVWSSRSVPAGTIAVTRIGGEVKLNGKSVGASISRVPLLVRGGRYLLFLDSLSAGQDYKSRETLDFIQDQGGQIAISGALRSMPGEFINPTMAFADTYSAAKSAATACR